MCPFIQSYLLAFFRVSFFRLFNFIAGLYLSLNLVSRWCIFCILSGFTSSLVTPAPAPSLFNLRTNVRGLNGEYFVFQSACLNFMRSFAALIFLPLFIPTIQACYVNAFHSTKCYLSYKEMVSRASVTAFL